jgi:hypothetical protein
LKNVYDQLYGALSMFAHGTATKIAAETQVNGMPPIYEHMSLVRGCVKCIHLIAANRIREGKPTPLAAIENILKVRLST